MGDHLTELSESIVVGTAGHIDHGKTSLIYALTGMDTDRLAEEKRRGISIDLGFAYLRLPGGQRVSFVDVPGHERFIRNMLAGVGGIEAALLIIAADEGVKPQTREHFEICRLLGIERGIVVLTKADIATAKQLSDARSAAVQLVSGSSFAHSPIVLTSAATGEGLEQLRNELQRLASGIRTRFATGLPRLAIDRSFALKGFGTIVTGTLSHGTLQVGDTVTLLPPNTESRIRGLQVHGESITRAVAGQRTAVNLSGISHSDVHRGFVVTRPRSLETTKTIHVSIEWLPRVEIPKRREDFTLHLGTSETAAHVKILWSDAAERRSVAQINLSSLTVALPRDRFVLRRPSPSETVGGGVVIDAFPPRRLNCAKTVERLRMLAMVNLQGRLEILVSEKDTGRRLSELVAYTGESLEEIKPAVLSSEKLLLVESAQRVVSQAWLTRRRDLLLQYLKTFHEKQPSLEGAPAAKARLGLELPLANFVFTGFSAIRVQGDLVSLSTHKRQITDQQNVALLNIEHEFRKAGYQPQPPAEVLRSAGADPKSARALLEALIKSGKLVRVSEELVFHADIIFHIRNSLSAHKGRQFSVPEFKEWTQISRKYAIPLLEYLDHQRVTRRVGDSRIVL